MNGLDLTPPMSADLADKFRQTVILLSVGLMREFFSRDFVF